MLTELQNYLLRLDDLRGQIINLINDLPAEALNWRPVEGSGDHATNSLAAMATHVAGSEQFWIAEVIGRRPARRNREAEFLVEAAGPAELVARLEQSGAVTREILSALSQADLDGSRQAGERSVYVRWVIVHVIDHTALHLGHMQLTYQLWQGGRATQAPRWFQRLPQA